MSGWRLARIAELCGGQLVNAPEPDRVCRFGAVAIDTRQLESGELFVALRGARDGHAFLEAAAQRGAAAALVDRRRDLVGPPGLPLIRVDDTLEALQRWAAAHRMEMNAELTLVTGSSGKTTTKDRIASVLATLGPTHATEGNRNNHLGVPLTLLGLRPEHRWAVVEIATNHPGEIAPLARLCRARHLVLTKVGWAHVGAFGSREAILAEKLAALAEIDADGLFFHEEDPWLLEQFPEGVRVRPRRTFGLRPEADCHPDWIAWEGDRTRFAAAEIGPLLYRCPGPGSLVAALAAIAVGSTFGAPPGAIREVLETARPQPLRMEPRPLAAATALLDCYNASPESSLAAIGFLQELRQARNRRLAFGEMRELGSQSEAAHRKLGEAAAGLDALYLIGEGCRPLLDAYRRGGGRGFARLYERLEDLAGDLTADLQENDIVLFKGARLMAMERAYRLCLEGLREKEG